MEYMRADSRNPYMGLNNTICKNPVWWCRLHQVWLSEEDVEKKHCMKKLTMDMMGFRNCSCIVKKD